MDVEKKNKPDSRADDENEFVIYEEDFIRTAMEYLLYKESLKQREKRKDA